LHTDCGGFDSHLLHHFNGGVCILGTGIFTGSIPVTFTSYKGIIMHIAVDITKDVMVLSVEHGTNEIRQEMLTKGMFLEYDIDYVSDQFIIAKDDYTTEAIPLKLLLESVEDREGLERDLGMGL